MKNLETYFIRHPRDEIALDDKTRERMWKDNRVFIHPCWDKSGNKRTDSKSKNPDDFKGSARKSLSALCRLASEGGYVCGHFSEHEEWLVGFVPPKSHVQLRKGKWPEDMKPPKKHNGISVIQTLLLHKARRVSPHVYARLQSAQPRRGTISCWPSIGDLVKSLVCNRRRRISFDGLGTNDQEVMCAEFLRLRETKRVGLPQLVCLLRDVGGTMKDLDILGIAADGKQIMAQITHYTLEASKEKLEKLRKYGDSRGNHLILFCDSKQRAKIYGVTVFPIREVYERFGKTPVGKLWKKHI